VIDVDEKGKDGAARKPRADGERNRARLIETAKQAFASAGGGASLDQIAREAGVGIGTLYRHFPTRDALIEAVYRRETDALLAASLSLAAGHPPLDALREWLRLFIDFMATKQGMAEALKTLIGGTDALYSDATERVTEALDRLVSAAEAEGAIRMDIEPTDLLRAIAGVMNLSPGKDWKRSAIRMVDVLLDGLRPDS
jgi:AcrR family transcriptional regulator